MGREPLRRVRSRPYHGTPGAPPGVLSPSAHAQPTRITVRRFGNETFEETLAADDQEPSALADPSICLWVEVTGLADVEKIASLGRAFGLHELSLEDVLDPAQRPKVEHYDDYTFVVLRTLATAHQVEPHRLSLCLGERFVLTFQDVDDATLEPVRQRLRHAKGKIRGRGADYLAYAIIDTVIDHYFPALEAFDDHLESVEDAVLEAKGSNPIDLARQARQDLQTIRRVVWPTRDTIIALLDEDVPWVTDETRVHLKDCYDHVVQLQEMIEASREIAASLLEAYISRVGLRTNEVMKVLTVIATLFIPLTFITGLYGMNFDPAASPLNMPELNWYWGYPFSLLVMVGSVVASLLFFRRKGWFGSRRMTRELP